MRLIDADALKPSYIVASTTTNTPCYRYVSIEDINSAPTIEAEPVRRGRWINHGSYVTCSECNEEQYGIDTGRFYCQNCGARMVKGEQDG